MLHAYLNGMKQFTQAYTYEEMRIAFQASNMQTKQSLIPLERPFFRRFAMLPIIVISRLLILT